MVEQTSIFSVPRGLGKAPKPSGVPSDISSSVYKTISSSLAAHHSRAVGIPIGTSILFCLSLQLGLSSQQDIVYMLIYALAPDALKLLEIPGIQGALCILTTAVGLSAVLSLLVRSLQSFYARRHAPEMTAPGEPRPMFFPVQTSHTRLFPKVHSLSYPFMWTGIPVGFRGNIGGILSCESKLRGLLPAWFTVDACDYMSRPNDKTGLDGKLREFLLAQGADPQVYPHAYLLTVSKFYGHAFNPVSLYYLYSTARILSAVILEVNNTFGERHLYFLNSSTTLSPTELNASTRFTSSFRKDLFVSPFNDRSGSYSLVTSDPLYPKMTGSGPIKLCITLSSDTGKPKVVARVYSNGSPVDPAELSWLQVQRFAISKAWDTWATEPRTIYQAALLMFKRGLSLFTVPEPLKTSISRRANGHEIVIDGVFRHYLQEVVRGSKRRLVVQYLGAGIPGATEELIESPAMEYDASKTAGYVSVRVLTPLFYARMVRYENVPAALREETRQGQTLEVEGLDELLKAAESVSQNKQSIRGPFDRVMLGSLEFLRRTPSPFKSKVPATNIAGEKAGLLAATVKIKNDLVSSNGADDLGPACRNDMERRLYLRAVFQLLLSDRIAFGNLDLLALERSIFRVGLMWMVGNGLRKALTGVFS